MSPRETDPSLHTRTLDLTPLLSTTDIHGVSGSVNREREGEVCLDPLSTPSRPEEGVVWGGGTDLRLGGGWGPKISGPSC